MNSHSLLLIWDNFVESQRKCQIFLTRIQLLIKFKSSINNKSWLVITGPDSEWPVLVENGSVMTFFQQSLIWPGLILPPNSTSMYKTDTIVKWSRLWTWCISYGVYIPASLIEENKCAQVTQVRVWRHYNPPLLLALPKYFKKSLTFKDTFSCKLKRIFLHLEYTCFRLVPSFQNIKQCEPSQFSVTC